MSIVLVGYRGSGKSTIGRKLADRLWQPFVDVDDLIVGKFRKNIKRIFEEDGEPAFRDVESAMVRDLCSRKDHVIGLGGGTLGREENRRVLKEAGHGVVYLRCDPAELARRIAADPQSALTRPNLTSLGGGIEEIRKMLAEREPHYRAVMTAELDVTRLTPDEAVVYITRLVQERHETLPDLVFILFVFLLGACIGSFLNVVVWRLPRGESLVTPPSHCPNCNRPLKWYDNLPIIGWIKLGGRCRFCKEPISIRYPIVEAVTGLLFVLYYVMFFMADYGPCVQYAVPEGIPRFVHVHLSITEHWPIYALDMLLVTALLAASLIDGELFIIPIEIPWLVAAFALLAHAVWDKPDWPGGLNLSPVAGALAAGAAVGVLISLGLLLAGILPTSFPDGGPLLEVDKAKLASQKKNSADPQDDAEPEREYSPKEIRAEMRKEMLFLLPPLVLGFGWVWATARIDHLRVVWEAAVSHHWVSGLLGSLLGLLIGGFVVWLTRILGSYGFGREAMGMGDVHLMAGVGAVLGGGAATIAFFLAPFFGIAVAIYMILTGTRRELPYGPYLSLATAFVILFYCPIAQYLAPGVAGLTFAVSKLFGVG